MRRTWIEFVVVVWRNSTFELESAVVVGGDGVMETKMLWIRIRRRKK